MITGTVCGLLGVILAIGITPVIPTVIAAILLAVVLRYRHRAIFHAMRLPWKIVIAVLISYSLISVVDDTNFISTVYQMVIDGEDFTGHFKLALAGALGANLFNNLPSFLLFSPIAMDTPGQAISLLVGVNAGCMVAPWGSMATLLWLWRCRQDKLIIKLPTFIGRSAILSLINLLVVAII